MRILILYSRMVPSWIPVFDHLISMQYLIDVVHWDFNKENSFLPPEKKGVNYFKRSACNYEDMKALFHSNLPNLVFISGWMDYDYLKIAFIARKKNIPVVFGCDNWWLGTVRQRVATLMPSRLRKMIFSHAWVSGPRQYEFCKRLGYSDDEIIHNLLSCDTECFNLNRFPDFKRAKQFIYVGRFSQEKGISTLADAFKIYRTKFNGDWKLLCVGSGVDGLELMSTEGIDIKPYTDSSTVSSLMAESSVFVMPSRRDFSPVAVHEAACAGLPLILSEGVGNADIYAIKKYNAMVFPVNDSLSLAKCFKAFENMSPTEILRMSKNSLTLSLRHNAEITAWSMLSIIN